MYYIICVLHLVLDVGIQYKHLHQDLQSGLAAARSGISQFGVTPAEELQRQAGQE